MNYLTASYGVKNWLVLRNNTLIDRIVVRNIFVEQIARPNSVK